MLKATIAATATALALSLSGCSAEAPSTTTSEPTANEAGTPDASQLVTFKVDGMT